MPLCNVRPSGRLSATLVCALLAAQSAALAQPGVQPSTQPVAGTLNEVTVRSEAGAESARSPVAGYRARRASTATKTDTALAETPQSVTVLTRDQMNEQGMGNLQDALGYAAGVRSDAYGIDGRTDSARIRGAAPVTYLNGLRSHYNYYTSTIRFDPYTLERVEVLRGPAGMLFGAGSVGGVVNLVNKRAQFDPVREVGVQLGSHRRRQVQADLGGAVNEQWAWRVVALARRADTQVDFVPDNRALLMPTLTWQPRAGTSLALHALWQKDESGSTSQFFPWAGTLYPARPGTLPTRRFIGEPDDYYDTEHRHIGWQLEHALNAQWTLRHSLRHSLNENEGRYHYGDFFTVVGGWGADPINQRLLARVLSDSRTRARMTTLDTHLQGHLTTGSVQHTLLAGLDIQRFAQRTWTARGSSRIDAWNPVYGQIGPASARAAQPGTYQRQLGLYVQEQARWQQWSFLAGLRHDRTASGAQGSAAVKDRATTHRLAAMYHTAAHLNPYLSYTESFLPQAPRNQRLFKPLKGKQWELGLKYEPPGQALALDAALYSLREENQIQSPRPDEYNQLGKTRGRGLELQARGAPSRYLDVLAHYNHTRVDAKLEGLPRHQASVWGLWRPAGVRQQGLSVGAGLRWMSAFHDRSGPRIPSSALIDLLLAWDAPQWRLALNVANATDKTYFATCLARGDCWWGARRNVVLSVTYKF